MALCWATKREADLPPLFPKHEAVEVTVGFVIAGTVLAALAVVLGRAWRPLP